MMIPSRWFAATIARFLRPACLLIVLLFAASVPAQRQLENLGRGVVGVHQPDGKVFISWRLLATDPEKTAFNVYRKTDPLPGRGFGRGFGGRPRGSTNEPPRDEPIKLNATPLTGPTWFVDAEANLTARTTYFVRPVVNSQEGDAGTPFVFQPGALPLPYLSIPLKPIEGYSAADGSVGDLDGDGEYEIVLIQNGRARDNGQNGPTDPPILQAYKWDGTLMWQIHLGKNIRAGAHYTQFMVYDLDGDGRAEIACKTADGTIDGAGKTIGDAEANHVNAQGRIARGPEFLTVFDGQTGAALATVNYVPSRHPAKQDPGPGELREIWGDDNGNRSERYLACVAYLDGQRPSLIMCRGYYTRSVLAAWDWRDGKLSQRWVFDSDATPENRKYRGQGNHNVSVADVDGDGRDEIIYGAMVVDDNGKGLYSTGWGHGDALHVSDLNPRNRGLEILSIQERFAKEGMNLRDARTGKPLLLVPSVQNETEGSDAGEGPGRGASFNIDPRHPGNESWAFGAGITGLYSAAGKRIAERTPRSCNFAVWWDGDLLRELLDRNQVSKWNWKEGNERILLAAHGATSINGTKATPVLSGDILGDWREEIIWRTPDSRELRIYTTTIPTEHRLFTLMHDAQYRCAIAWQNVAYNQPPHPSFYLDESAPLPKRPAIAIPSAAARIAGR
ncbi:MAG TPA: rhamnogalacturonan lyase [Verrucomicrobiae bacterium]|nr:rhamnogalacturonan lyase [Verrucomicrobiae bacterium]